MWTRIQKEPRLLYKTCGFCDTLPFGGFFEKKCIAYPGIPPQLLQRLEISWTYVPFVHNAKTELVLLLHRFYLLLGDLRLVLHVGRKRPPRWHVRYSVLETSLWVVVVAFCRSPSSRRFIVLAEHVLCHFLFQRITVVIFGHTILERAFLFSKILVVRCFHNHHADDLFSR